MGAAIELRRVGQSAGIVRGGLDNYRGLPPKPAETVSVRGGMGNYRGALPKSEAKASK